jgi:hypoxanthine phosphoribosyltransferase
MICNDVQTVLIDKDEIDSLVSSLGRQISGDYKNKNLLVIGVLKGSFIFMSDLLRRISLPLNVDFICASSYGNGTTSGELNISKDIDYDISDFDVLLVEDILDTGRTLRSLSELLLKRGAKSVRICAFLDKPSRRTADINADYCGKTVPDEFVVGYGLDYAERYRNLPYVGILKPDIYS